MKKWYKKVNRGLILGAVLVVGLTAFILVDNYNFRKEEPDIEKTVSDFVSELWKYNITPEKYREKGAVYSDGDKQKMKDEFSEFSNKYWVETDEDYDVIPGFSNVKSGFSGSINNIVNDENSGYVTKFAAAVFEDVTITKEAPKMAKASCTVKLDFTGTPGCTIICPGGYDNSYRWDENGNEEDEPELVETTLEQTCYFNLLRTSDGWKITRCEFYDGDFGETAIEDTDAEDQGGNTAEEENQGGGLNE